MAQDFFASVPTQPRQEPNLETPWSHRAWLQQKTGYGWNVPALPASRDRAALTRTETHLFAELSWRRGPWRAQLGGSLVQDWLPNLESSGLWSGYEFTGEQRRERRLHVEMADSFVSWQEGDWWIKAGYQTLAWGEAESLKVTDVLARRDQRWPGQEDLEKLRLPVGALRVTWNNQLDFAALIEPLPDLLPAAYDEFDPYFTLRSGAHETSPSLFEGRDHKPGLALRYREHWQGLDAQLLIADVASFELAPEMIEFKQINLNPWRQQVAGVSLQSVTGNFVLRTEQAWHHNTKVASRNPIAPWRDTNQWRGMLGADYTGVNNLQLSAEFSWLYIDDWRPSLADERWQPGASARANYTLYNERLTLEAFALTTTGDQGDVYRLSADWAVTDEFSVSLAAIEYHSDDSQQRLYPYRRNDTLLLSLRWGL